MIFTVSGILKRTEKIKSLKHQKFKGFNTK